MDKGSSLPTSSDVAALRARISELEALCSEVYVAAVDLGLPQPLLNRLWTVAAHGSTPQAFDINLPLRHAVAQNDTRAPVPQAELAPLPERRTVMVVDDDAMMLEVLARILQRENYELLTAAGGPEALKVVEGHAEKIDLLITDYAMPEMKGRELAERLRERYPGIKVLYQTGFSDLLFEDRIELEDGASFLEKPFTARGLREAARFSLFGVINPQ